MTRMFTANGLALAAALTICTGSASAGSFTINFDSLRDGDYASSDPVAQAHGVTFKSAYLTADLDDEGYEILDLYGNFIPGYTHWTTYTDDFADLIVRDPNYYGRGDAPSGTLALDAMFDQTLIGFATPLVLTGFSFDLDASRFGYPFAMDLLFLDGDGKTIFDTSFVSSGLFNFDIEFAPLLVHGILLPSTSKLYDTLTFTTATQVAAPAGLLLLSVGFGVLGLATSRRRIAKGA